jgi:hypothetical protein
MTSCCLHFCSASGLRLPVLWQNELPNAGKPKWLSCKPKFYLVNDGFAYRHCSGAGIAGITAAVRSSALYLSLPLGTDCLQQALSNASVHDFLIVEYNGEIGGRVAHTTFGNSSVAKAYTVELGANWVRRAFCPEPMTADLDAGTRASDGKWTRESNLVFGVQRSDYNPFEYAAHKADRPKNTSLTTRNPTPFPLFPARC